MDTVYREAERIYIEKLQEHVNGFENEHRCLCVSHQAVRVGYWLMSRSGVKITSPCSMA